MTSLFGLYIHRIGTWQELVTRHKEKPKFRACTDNSSVSNGESPGGGGGHSTSQLDRGGAAGGGGGGQNLTLSYLRSAHEKYTLSYYTFTKKHSNAYPVAILYSDIPCLIGDAELTSKKKKKKKVIASAWIAGLS